MERNKGWESSDKLRDHSELDQVLSLNSGEVAIPLPLVLKGRYFEEEGLKDIFQDLLFAVEGALLLACLCRGPPALATITER